MRIDPVIKELLRFLANNPRTSEWFKGTNDLVKDFKTNIIKQFPKMKLL